MKEQSVTAVSQFVIPVFDGHNDTIMRIRNGETKFFEENAEGHIDLPRARRGGLAGGFFAVWVPDEAVEIDPNDPNTSAYSGADTLPPMMSTESAQHYALASLGRLLRLEQESNGDVVIVRTVDDLRKAIESGTFALELHFEGAEPIDPGLDALEVFYAAGVRSLGLVWSRSNLFGHGVPFQFPGSPDTGPGLTDAGKALVRRCNELGVMLDVSHLNEKGFWDLAGITDAPIVATHACAHAISPSTRNLTDKQLDAIKESDGIVGLNFHVGFLNPTGSREAADTNVGIMADQMDYLIEKIGIDRVALGSDFDGAVMPGDLKDSAGLPLLMNELRGRGYDAPSLLKIGYQNWLRVFGNTWKA
jgi:membrane dipeptidase